MNVFIGESIVNCYVDAASFLVMILLLLLSERLQQKKAGSFRIYYLLSITVAFTCIVCFVFNIMYGHTEVWCHTVALISRTLWELCVLVTVWLWLYYVDYTLYGKRKGWTFMRLYRTIPVCVFLLLLIVNLFTGLVFTLSEDNLLQPKPLYYVFLASIYLLFLSSALAVSLYDRKRSKIRFLHIAPMIVSVFVAILPQLFSPYNTGILGYAIGMTLMYFSMVSEIRFVDEESGLYNIGYLAYLYDLAAAGQTDSKSVIIIEADGNHSAVFHIVKDVLDQEGDVIRVEKNRFLMFTKIDSRSTLQYLSSLVDEAAEKHNTEHPDEKVQITARCRMRAGDEDPITFLHTVMEEKETGDEMRGIVSMISELDRLDEELKLASDIQLNSLPMNFPDRKEFDLYASMTAAKEVGGDFYDFFLIDDDHLAMVVADVSGKGIPASLLMMVSKTLIRNQLMLGCDPATALERVNLQLCERNSTMMFVTVWAAVMEFSTGRITACNAGHENPAVCLADNGRFELYKYRHDMFIGVNKKAKYQNRESYFRSGDCLFVYTDGVTEATNINNEMFGEKRLVETLNQSPDAGSKDIIHRMREAVDSFAAGVPQFDDITMLCLRYHGAQKTKEDS